MEYKYRAYRGLNLIPHISENDDPVAPYMYIYIYRMVASFPTVVMYLLSEKWAVKWRRKCFPAVTQVTMFLVMAQKGSDQMKKDKLDDLICKINNGFEHGQISDIVECTKELGEMIERDPRLGDLLGMDFLRSIVSLLKRDKNPYLQAYAATILTPIVAFSRNTDEVDVVIQSITPVVLSLICSPVALVKVKALWLLRNLVLKISKSSVEEALAPVTSIILEDSIGFGVLRPASEVLLVVCGVHPKISREKLKLVLPALMKLIASNVLLLMTAGCWGFAYLCDGREEVIVEDKDLKRLIRRFVNLMNWREHTVIISGLLPLGSIARWGNDDVIEAIIKDEGSLRILSILLEVGDMYMVKQICWIISNITARKGKHIRAVIDGVTDRKLIDPLANVVRNCKLRDVVKEALWAISNAMCGVDLDQRVCLMESCCVLNWAELLIQFQRDILLVLVIIEGLVNIEAGHVLSCGPIFSDGVWQLIDPDLCRGEPSFYAREMRIIDGFELHYIFKRILHDSDLCSLDDNVQISDAKVAYILHFLPRGFDGDFYVVYDHHQRFSIRRGLGDV